MFIAQPQFILCVCVTLFSCSPQLCNFRGLFFLKKIFDCIPNTSCHIFISCIFVFLALLVTCK